MQHDAKSELLQPFIELIRGGSPEVVAKKVTTIQLDRILIGCNQLLRGTGAWRSHAAPAACELSRTEARTKDDKEDAAREKEEKRLWSKDRLIQNATPKKEESPSPNKSGKNLSLPKSPDSRNTSPWRTQRRAVAVVRPQPVVVMRSASPVPKLSDTNGRPSRLPLSTASREKEALKKGISFELGFTTATATFSNSVGSKYHEHINFFTRDFFKGPTLSDCVDPPRRLRLETDRHQLHRSHFHNPGHASNIVRQNLMVSTPFPSH
ncbi:hypothetical protein OSTOST_16231 [Ostertagia ostertagi]